MAEFYSFANVDDATPVEITGGRVGHFKVFPTNQQLRMGDNSVTSSSQFLVPYGVFDLSVTSPDEIYVIAVTGVTDVHVFHNR